MTTVVDSEVIFADGLSEDGVDYGTGYYVTKFYSNGMTDLFGPYNFEEDALTVATVYWFLLFIMNFDSYENDDIFTILGIAEEWEDESVEAYVSEDTKTLKEYGYIRWTIG